ncbi:phytoene desaturase family protein [Sphingobacterium paludis]|uniref:Phytoene dehydrogenase-like protein n=1 Tax=Sphingobacterium paludis TaxID=1476465 RepID=A0A4R7CYK1_9SPHI|nr:NAD(P)/FAD-dependent oxidoreductase [Sphingobacterium paludis]TDS12972.1 phytoene dehydrogenase-like protein [Sphingobacterium paludis]
MGIEKQYDAIVVGAGPNGLAAAITLQRAGKSTLLLEGAEDIGGGLRTKELTLPGYRHDVCSAIHPMAMASPFFRTLPLKDHGLELLFPEIAAAHPLDDGSAGLLYQEWSKTQEHLGKDAGAYRRLIRPVVDNWESLADATMGPLRFPKDPLGLASFGLNALQPASWIAKRFSTAQGKALWGGMAAHGIQPLSNFTTAAIGIVLSAVGHRYGWPVPKGGSQSIAKALLSYYNTLGGDVQTGFWLEDVRALPKHDVLILDLTPKQLLALNGVEWSNSYRRQLERFTYGMGVFKVDWALAEPTPFKNGHTRQAGTVHLGNTFAEIAENEWRSSKGRHVQQPFVLFSQPSLFDHSRSPEGKHVGWAYCHVPHGSTQDMTAAIESQVERFAPGFKDTILATHTFNTRELQVYNPNYIGGDINGGLMNLAQLYTRPTLSLTPYRTSKNNIYICSSSTPPGGGVHGMCGFHAAKTALYDHFEIKP